MEAHVVFLSLTTFWRNHLVLPCHPRRFPTNGLMFSFEVSNHPTGKSRPFKWTKVANQPTAMLHNVFFPGLQTCCTDTSRQNLNAEQPHCAVVVVEAIRASLVVLIFLHPNDCLSFACIFSFAMHLLTVVIDPNQKIIGRDCCLQEIISKMAVHIWISCHRK